MASRAGSREEAATAARVLVSAPPRRRRAKDQYRTQYNLLFADILLITIPPLIMFIFFNRKIVAGLTAGAIKG